MLQVSLPHGAYAPRSPFSITEFSMRIAAVLTFVVSWAQCGLLLPTYGQETKVEAPAPSPERPPLTGPKPEPIEPPAPSQIELSVKRGVDFLVSDQNKDGSWGSARNTKG